MEEAVSPENYGKALKAVVANKGSPGIDGMTTEELSGHLKKHWPKIHGKLLEGSYVPSPVRRKEIRKENGGGTRMLGIPTVLDRFIQQLLLQVMTPIWEPRFSEHSYGFRPGRKAAFAVRAAQRYVEKGQDWVVDLDNHQIFRSRQLGHPDGEGRSSDPRQTGVETDREIPAGGSHGGRGGGQERGRNAARRAAIATAGEHLPGRPRSRTGTAQTFVLPVRGRLQHLRRQSKGGGTGEGVDTGMDRKATAATVECHQERGREDLGTEVSGIPTEPPATDRSGTGESGTVQNEGTGEVAELPESDE